MRQVFVLLAVVSTIAPAPVYSADNPLLAKVRETCGAEIAAAAAASGAPPERVDQIIEGFVRVMEPRIAGQSIDELQRAATYPILSSAPPQDTAVMMLTRCYYQARLRLQGITPAPPIEAALAEGLIAACRPELEAQQSRSTQKPLDIAVPVIGLLKDTRRDELERFHDAPLGPPDGEDYGNNKLFRCASGYFLERAGGPK